MSNSNTAAADTKPDKPTADFPLFPHATKRWAKKVKGKTYYFGPWRDPQSAFAEWVRVKDALLAGLPYPEHRPDTYAVADVCEAFLQHRNEKVKAGTLKQRTWNEYKDVCEVMMETFGKERYADEILPPEFAQLRKKLANGKRPKTIHNLITRCMAVINFSNKNGLTDRPILTGTYFEKPSAKELREDRASQDHGGELMFEAHQIQDFLVSARPVLKAMILLAINVGMGNEDCGQMEFRHFDSKTRWLDFPRPKTSVKRRARLWPETVAAIQAAVAQRKKPKRKEFEELVFLTRTGGPWFSESNCGLITKEFGKLLKTTGHHVKGVNFYSLRRTFETIACETKDQPAVDMSMGHECKEMSALYRQRLGDDRLKAVSKYVRKWLFGKRRAK